MKRLVHGLVAVVIFVLSLAVPAAWAQEAAPTLAQLSLSVWPEFDRQAVLVIYRGEFAAGTSLPLAVEILIPAGAGEPSAVAYQDDQGKLLTLAYTTEARGDQLAVQFELPTLAFQLEYYQEEWLAGQEGRRQFAFRYTPEYPVQSLRLDILQPPGATDWAISPPADETLLDSGLTYSIIQRTDLPAGESLAWEISYVKTDDALVLPPTQAIPGGAPSTETGGGSLTALWVVLGVVAVAAMGGGAYWLGRRQATPTRKGKPGPAERTFRTVEGTPFCHKCGNRLKPGAEFCHQCGARVKDI